MTYRELLQLYKQGKLDMEKKKTSGSGDDRKTGCDQ